VFGVTTRLLIGSTAEVLEGLKNGRREKAKRGTNKKIKTFFDKDFLNFESRMGSSFLVFEHKVIPSWGFIFTITHSNFACQSRSPPAGI